MLQRSRNDGFPAVNLSIDGCSSRRSLKCHSFTSLRLRMAKAMENHNRSPQINHVSWGRLEVEGTAEPYKDAKLLSMHCAHVAVLAAASTDSFDQTFAAVNR